MSLTMTDPSQVRIWLVANNPFPQRVGPFTSTLPSSGRFALPWTRRGVKIRSDAKDEAWQVNPVADEGGQFVELCEPRILAVPRMREPLCHPARHDAVSQPQSLSGHRPASNP